MDHRYILILVTTSSEKEATDIGRDLVEKKLAACVNVFPLKKSIFYWGGKLCEEEEFLIFIKSRKDLFPSLQTRIRALHSYETPEIIALPIVMGDNDYFKWMEEVLKAKEDY